MMKIKHMFLIMVITGILLMVCGFSFPHNNDVSREIYPTLFIVDEITPLNDNWNVVSFIDCNGNIFTYLTDDHDIYIGEYYTAIMDTHETPIIYDDVIVSIKYARVDLFYDDF